MTENSLRKRLAGHPWAQWIHFSEQTFSTNADCRALGLSGAPEGACCIALRQTGGRGRLGRSFVSEEGGLYLSVLLRPDAPPPHLLHLSAAAGVACADAVEAAFGLSCGIKWPNDLTIAGRKLGGILSELVLTPGTDRAFAILGIGINCRQAAFPPELADTATSVQLQTGLDADPEVLAAALLRELETLSRTFLSEKADWMARCRSRCVTLGKPVRLSDGETQVEAVACALGENGELLVRLPDGAVRPVACGEVSVRGLYGYV